MSHPNDGQRYNQSSQQQATVAGNANQWAQQSPQTHSYQPPSGPPPGTAPRKTGTFQESDFVPETERGEQREAMEQFEMTRSRPESETDRNVATLQQEYPAIDGSLIAALYGDSNSLAATRELLQEIASQNQS